MTHNQTHPSYQLEKHPYKFDDDLNMTARVLSNKYGRMTDDGRRATDDVHSTILKPHTEQAQVS
jgi:hypothetical protein